MGPTTVHHPRCTCSAFFETNDDLEKHLDENLEQERFRDQWIQWLETEVRRYRSHRKIAHDEFSEERNTLSSDNRGDAIRPAERSISAELRCPSCERTQPFKTKQKLRVHYEQHVSCHETCVHCTKVFRVVRELRRHTETCTGNEERKISYMRLTSDELRELADKQLDLALREKARKRMLPESDINTEESQPQPKARRPNSDLECENSLRRGEIPLAAILPTITTPATALTHMRNVDALQEPQQLLGNSADQINALDLVEDFDAPLMRIMNGVPFDQWEAEVQHDGILSSNDASAC
ncbi:hypothetical protein Purlil1_12070 [Purpureocillium lilacinum]|uniref:C2H2-type domain-containing protein n=1 Tax=Purpureocillium lilacinum TaxID=33203 RepID=A0ABR0BHX4_PURLI|nr:hypothetical protein Purlil1_12070 [Purpureocillium lilacinum]